MESGRFDAQLAPIPWLRKSNVPHVELEIEVVVWHPVRMIEAQRHLHQFLAKRGDSVLCGTQCVSRFLCM